jgi:hypothetical protein
VTGQPALFPMAASVSPAPPDQSLRALAAGFDARWPGRWHLGTSSWHFPGWAGQVWDKPHASATLSRDGLGSRLGVLVLQVSPLPARWLHDRGAWRAHLARLLAALLREHGVRPCLGLHDRMPPAQAQLPFLRAAWPGDLVCRWNLQRGQRYAQARDRWAPFDRLQAEDPETRAAIARAARGTLDAGFRAFVTINNKAEGCAPASVAALARALS